MRRVLVYTLLISSNIFSSAAVLMKLPIAVHQFLVAVLHEELWFIGYC